MPRGFIFVIFIALLVAISGTSARAENQIYLGGVFSNKFLATQGTGPTVTTSYSRKLAPAFGVGAGFPLSWTFSIEANLLYLPRTFEYQLTGSTTTTRQQLIQLPVMLRWVMLPKFTLKAGLYYGKYIGSVSTTTTTATGSTTKLSTPYAAAGQTGADYGAVLGVGYDIPLGDQTGILIDARYNIGLANNAKDDLLKVTFDDYLFLVGLRIGARRAP